MSKATKRMSLKAFFEALEGRLDTLSPADLRSVIGNMAKAVPPDSRHAFLEKLEPGGKPEQAIAEALGQDDLLSDIDDLAREVADRMQSAEEWEEEYRYRDCWDDEDSAGPYEQFTDTLSALFDRAAGVFDSGNLELAVEAYRRLLQVFGEEDDYGGAIDADAIGQSEVAEACARYLRAVYETTPLGERPAALFEEMTDIARLIAGARCNLADIVDITDRPLPDRERFLDDWIELLGEEKSHDADRWLREAVRLSGGTEALERLAREQGRKHPLAYVDWLAALNKAGHGREAAHGAREALDALPDGLPVRAAVADELCAAAKRLNDQALVREARWQAFVAKPELRRLADLAFAMDSESERRKAMGRAAAHVEKRLKSKPRPSASFSHDLDSDPREQPAWISKSVLAHAWLLAGEWERARMLAKKERVLGWSDPETVQSLVLPAILLALSGRKPAIPANVKGLWDDALQRCTGWMNEIAAQELDRLYEQAFAVVAPPASLAEGLLAWCRDVAEKRAVAIVDGKHRKSYWKAALVAAAVAETLMRRDKKEEATTVLQKLRARFPRHRAFLGELRSAESRMGRLFSEQ
jgi:hypothetical protein